MEVLFLSKILYIIALGMLVALTAVEVLYGERVNVINQKLQKVLYIISLVILMIVTAIDISVL
jgi:hypothetical protein